MRHTRLLAITALALAALPAGALTQQQQIEVVQTVGGGPTVIMGGGSTPLAPIQQTGTSMLVGRVVDAGTGSPVAGALVAIGGAMRGAMRGVGGGGTMVFTMPGGRAGGGPAGGDADPVPRVLTDSNGRFAFRNLPAGTFNLTAEKSGYLDGAYGRLRPEGASQSVDVKEGEHLTDVSIRVFKAAAITGRLVDARGEPIVGADVRAYRRELQSGRRVLDTEGLGAVTDDRGVYRIANLTPGEYVIAAPTVVRTVPTGFELQGGLSGDLISTLMRPGSGNFSLSLGGGAPIGNGQFAVSGDGRSGNHVAPEMDGRLLTYPSVYHPAASTVSEAAVIAVASGEERSGIDIAVPLVATSTISGRLMGPDGPAAGYGLHLVPSNTGDVSFDPDVATAITSADGSFMFAGVPAGSYVIQTVRVPRGLGVPGIDGNFAARGGRGTFAVAFATTEIDTGRGGGRITRAEPADPEPTLWVAMPIAVDTAPVAGVALTLQEGLTISGRIEFEGAAERPTPEQMARIVVVADAVDGNSMTPSASGTVTEDGRFETSGLLPGRYVLRAVNAGQAWTMRSAVMGGVDVSDAPLNLERNTQGVTVTFTDRAASVTGVVRNTSGQPDDAAAVLVFPADNRRWVDYGTNPRRMRLARTSGAGNYTFSALPAGDYYLVAIGEEYSGEWQDPRFLEQVALQANRVTVNEGSAQTQDLTTQPFRGVVGVPSPAAVPAWPVDADGHGPFVPEDVAPAPPAWPASWTPSQQRDTRAAPAAGAATVSGRVLVDDGSNQPLRRARVSLRSAETRLDYAVMTDDQGQFRITGVPAGRYSLSATKPAYITAYYGSRRAGRGPGAPVAVTAGATVSNLELRMPRGAVVSGRVFDEFGQPMANVSVRVAQAGGANRGASAFNVAGIRSSSTTDDRGMYRLYGLMPGEYLVMVSPPRAGSGEIRQLTSGDVDTVLADMQGPQAGQQAPLGGRAVGYAPVYYPGTTSASSAAAVTLSSGQVLENVDMPVPLVPTARIEGTILGPDGAPVPGVSALLLPETTDSTLSFNIQSIVRTDQDGRFTAMNVVPGRYKLSARSGSGGTQVVELSGGNGMFISRTATAVRRDAPAPPAGDPPKPLWAEALIDVNGQDLSGLVLTMQEGMTLTGRVVFDGTMAPPEDLSQVRINVTQAAQNGISLNVPSSRVNADGTFALEGVTPGAYRVSATVPPSGFSANAGWVARSAMAGNRDVLDVPLEVAAGLPPEELVVTFTDRQSELSGTVLDPSGAPVSDLTILVFPTSPEMWAPNGRRMPPPQQPGSDGQFRFESLPAGEYILAAVTELEDNDWGDPGFMEQVAAAGIRLTVAEGEKKVQDLRLGGGF